MAIQVRGREAGRRRDAAMLQLRGGTGEAEAGRALGLAPQDAGGRREHSRGPSGDLLTVHTIVSVALFRGISSFIFLHSSQNGPGYFYFLEILELKNKYLSFLTFALAIVLTYKTPPKPLQSQHTPPASILRHQRRPASRSH